MHRQVHPDKTLFLKQVIVLNILIINYFALLNEAILKPTNFGAKCIAPGELAVNPAVVKSNGCGVVFL